MNRSEVLFVTPSPAMLRAGAEWVVVKNWVDGARNRWTSARILTPIGYLDDSDLRAAAWGRQETRNHRSRSGPITRIVETAVKDARSLKRMHRFDRQVRDNPPPSKPVFVWQYHSLFQRAGFTIGRRTGNPVVLYVAAPQVWEAAAWGVKRPIWGHLVERFGESPFFAGADLVACVSEEVAHATIARGAASDRVVVTPTTADAFRDWSPLNDMRRSLGLGESSIVGWVGSFRSFHNAEMLLRVIVQLQRDRDVALVMIGDGPTRGRCVDLADDLGIRKVVFTGVVPHDEIGDLLAIFDVAVITNRPGAQFHYSPLKLKEYLAAGRAVVAPAVGEITRMFNDGTELLMYSEGDDNEMAEAIGRVLDDPALRLLVSTNGQAAYDRMFTMAPQLDMVARRLGVPLATEPE